MGFELGTVLQSRHVMSCYLMCFLWWWFYLKICLACWQLTIIALLIVRNNQLRSWLLLEYTVKYRLCNTMHLFDGDGFFFIWMAKVVNWASDISNIAISFRFISTADWSFAINVISTGKKNSIFKRLYWTLPHRSYFHAY